jgi:transposase InsO family protein
MSWHEVDTMSLRYEFVTLGMQEGANIRRLCRGFSVSPKTGYKWLARYAIQGAVGLADRSRRPVHRPTKTAPGMESAALEVRDAHPAWGGRKIRAVLVRQGYSAAPSASTITEILRRHGRLVPEECDKHRPWQRFEAPHPNALWQMDFKGHLALTAGGRCHPLTVLDDHSRFALAIQACPNEQGTTVQRMLIPVFERYGLPEWILADNGSPWGPDELHPYTPLTVWWLRLGIGVTHGRPYHPQTQGKDERFHRTLADEVVRRHTLTDLDHCQYLFDRWRIVYNLERPHEALQDAVPGSRYQPSPRPYPHELPPIEYGPHDAVRKVQALGWVHYQGYVLRLPDAFRGYTVAIRHTTTDGILDIQFCRHRIAQVDLRDAVPGSVCVTYVPEHL